MSLLHRSLSVSLVNASAAVMVVSDLRVLSVTLALIIHGFRNMVILNAVVLMIRFVGIASSALRVSMTTSKVQCACIDSSDQL